MFMWTWLLGMLSVIPATVHLYPRTIRGKVRCMSLMLTEQWIGFLILGVSSVMSLFGPCGIMLYVYIHMGLILYSGRKMGNDTDNSTSSARNKSLRKAHSNILQTCILLCTFYLITYISYYYQIVKLVLFNNGTFQDIELYVSQYMITVNSWINPFIYAFR